MFSIAILTTTPKQYWPCNIPRPCRPLTLYGDSIDCSSVHLCLGSGRFLFSFKCPGTLVFDTVSKECLNRPDAVCTPPCNTAPSTTMEGSGEVTPEGSGELGTRPPGKQ